MARALASFSWSWASRVLSCLQLAAAQRDFLVILVGVPVFQGREPGLEGVDADPGRLPGFLRPLFLPSGRGGFVDRGDDRSDVPGGGVHPGRDLVGLVPGVGAEVGGVLGQEGADRRVGGGQVVVLLLDGGQVLEVPGGLLDQVFVNRAEAGRQGAGHLDRVEVLGQQRPAQRDQQVQQLGVAFAAQAEQAGVHGVLVGAAPVPEGGVAAEDGGELLGGQRAGIGGQQAEVDAHPLVRDEEGGAGALPVFVRGQADDQGDGLLLGAGVRGVGGLGEAAELHPDVAVLGVLPPVEQVGLHGAVLAAERVEPPRVQPAVQDEREQHFEGLGLAGAVVAAQRQPAVAERELLVEVVPEVDDPGPGRLEPRAGGATALWVAVTRILPSLLNRSKAPWPSRRAPSGSAAVMLR